MFHALGDAFGVPTYVELDETRIVLVGSGRTSYEQEIDGYCTDYGCAAFGIGLMLAVRAGQAIYYGSIRGYPFYTLKDNTLFLAFLMGLAVICIGELAINCMGKAVSFNLLTNTAQSFFECYKNYH